MLVVVVVGGGGGNPWMFQSGWCWLDSSSAPPGRVGWLIQPHSPTVGTYGA
jgi:hypothetical protein